MRMVRSKTVQLFYRKDGEPIEFYPRFCMDDGVITATGAPCLSNGLTLTEQMRRKPDSTICFWRTYALGDILILTPIFNSLKEKYPNSKILFATADNFVPIFQYWDEVRTIRKNAILRQIYDIGYYLDGVVEKDHRGGKYSYMHRLDLYCNFLGIPVPKDPIFSLPYGEDERKWAENIVNTIREPGKPIIALQIFGSTHIKRLPFGKMMRIAVELSKTCSVIFIHSHKEGRPPDSVLDLSGATSVHQLAALIDLVDAVITMDSGVLWIAHCTQTPVIALLGPTREQERLTYHRNYHAINLSKMVGCEPCFERMTRCRGSVNCMTRSDEGKIIKEIKDGIGKLVS